MNSKLVITYYKNCIGDFLFSDGSLKQLYLDPDENIVGNIYVGAVKNIVKNLNAAFVEYAPGMRAFLPLNDKLTGSVKEGDLILIQIEKAAVKTKDPVATVQLSVSGFYSVISDRTGKEAVSYSRKISAERKAELKEYFDGRPEIKNALDDSGFAAVIRTSAGGPVSLDTIAEELLFSLKLMQNIKNNGRYRTPYSLLYRENRDYLKQICKWNAGEFDEVVTDVKEIYNECRKLPLSVDVRYYEDDSYPLRKLYSLDSKMEELLHKQVYLKSGGNIVIEATEALTVIDVNTGKNIKKRDPDTLAYETNREAAEEIAKQLILRNISGIVIVDYINMRKESFQEELISFIRNLCRKDSVECVYIDFTPLGLVEMTRKKVSPPLSEIMKNLS